MSLSPIGATFDVPDDLILVIAAEDEKLNIRFLEKAFDLPQANKYALLIVENGEEIKKALTGQQFTTYQGEIISRITSAHRIICLMDRHMPIMTGDEATIAIRQAHSQQDMPDGIVGCDILAYSTDISDLYPS
jgi:CheY-like chemotaxis protein